MNNLRNVPNNQDVSNQIIKAIHAVIGKRPANLHEPVFEGNEWHYLKDCLDSGFVSSIGQYVDQFEQKIAEYTGANHAIAVVNGTAALHLAMIVAGVQSGDEVLMPSLTFVATANSVSYVGAVPHFVDIRRADFGIDTATLRDYLKKITILKDGYCLNKNTGRVIRALMPMHVFGHPCNMNDLLSIADEFHLTLIEDAAESLGSFYHQKHAGTFGALGILSFNGNKTITTGGGGVILTDDAEIASRAKHLSTTAKQPHAFAYKHTDIGFNYRMPNLNAALGCAQLEQLPQFLKSKRRLYKLYADSFAKVENVSLFQEPNHCHSNYWLQTLILDEQLAPYHEDIIRGCINAGINVRPVWTPLHLLPIYSASPAAPLSVTNTLANQLINIPSSAGIA